MVAERFRATARHPHRAERRPLRRRQRRQHDQRSSALPRTGKADRELGVRHRPQPALRHRLLSAGAEPAMGLRRQRRQHRPLPYKDGDLKATGKAEQIVGGIPANHHWTRDIVFSPDGKTLYLSVGSGSNIGEEVTDKPGNGIDALRRRPRRSARNVGAERRPRRRARLRPRRQEPPRRRHRHPQLLGHDAAAGDQRALVRHQRARRPRRQSRAGLRHHGEGRRVLRLALVLHRHQRGSAAAEGPAPRPRRTR